MPQISTYTILLFVCCSWTACQKQQIANPDLVSVLGTYQVEGKQYLRRDYWTTMGDSTTYDTTTITKVVITELFNQDYDLSVDLGLPVNPAVYLLKDSSTSNYYLFKDYRDIETDNVGHVNFSNTNIRLEVYPNQDSIVYWESSGGGYKNPNGVGQGSSWETCALGAK